MQLTHNLMDLYFNYNGRVGDVKGAQEGIEEFEQIAKTASTEEEKLHYERAAEQLKTEILPKMQQEMEQLAKELGLDSNFFGKVAKTESKELTTLAINKQSNGKLLLLNSYEIGNYYHNKIQMYADSILENTLAAIHYRINSNYALSYLKAQQASANSKDKHGFVTIIKLTA